MKFNFEWSWRITKLGRILLAVLAVEAVASAGIVYYLYKNNNLVAIRQDTKPPVDFPVYYAIQNDTAKIYTYDTELKENKEVLSIPLEKDFYRFGADYSAKNNQIIYSDPSGIWSYNLQSGEKAQFVSNKQNSGKTAENDAEYYFAPKFSRDNNVIIYMTGFAEGPGAKMNVMTSEGKEIREIKGLYAHSNNFRWTSDGRFVTGNGMDGSNFAVSAANDLTKTRQIDLTSKAVATGGYDLDITNNLLVVGSSDYDKPENNGVYTVNLDGTNVQTLTNAKNTVSGLIYDAYEQKVLFSETDYKNKKGLGLFEIIDGGPVQFYKDGDKNIFPELASKDFIAASSNTFGETGFSMKTLFLINKADKSVVDIGESGNNGFIGWIKSNRLPKNLTKVSALSPTDKEKEQYADSQKTHGYLNGSYYDYCWDYDCQSPTYPFPKLTSSKMPEVVNFQSGPFKLTGSVSIPVVYLYKDAPFTDEQISIVQDDASAKESFKKLENWLNDQMSSRKKATSVTFVNKGKVQAQSDCIQVNGTSRNFDSKCLHDAAVNAIPELRDAPLIITVLMNINGYSYNRAQRIDDSHMIYQVPMYLTSSMDFANNNSYYNAEQKAAYIKGLFTTGENMGWNYSIMDFLSLFGAKNKNATYKQPKDASSPGCFINDANDVTCNTNFNNQNNYRPFTEKVLTATDKKEFGWYDADGDGVDEVDDKCPFDKNNRC